MTAREWPVAFLALLSIATAVPAWGEVSDKIARVVSIAPGTPISIEITIGRVVVHGWERDDVSIEVVRRAPDQQRLSRVPAQVEQAADGLVVRAVQVEGGRDPDLQTNVTLRVPWVSRLSEVVVYEGRIDLSDLRGASSARLERGDILAKQVTGAIRLETTIGNIRLERATLAPNGLMRLRTFNGDVNLELAGVPRDARIMALSMGGAVTSAIPLTLKARWGPRFGEATLGTGEPVISIDVVNGDVTITVADGAR